MRLRFLAALLLAATGSAGVAAEVCQAENGYAASFGGRRTFALRPADLTAIKAALPTDSTLKPAYDELIRRANAALTQRPGSVMDKRTIPPSGDRHDYLSVAPYWWPDPANPTGPYIRRDGQFNPERDGPKYDRTSIGRMGSNVQALTLAYYYTGDDRYARKAGQLIRTWFLDPATAMNPNANFAQAVRGREDGRAEGVLDTSVFMDVVEGVGLIAPSGALTADETKALEAWFGRYVDWMLTSRNGKEERAAKNNHGIWYDAQITRYALFARRPDVARKVVAAFGKDRLSAQLAPDGRLPGELTRTRSLHYSIFALDPAYDVAAMGACLGIDWWNWQDDKGRSLRRATDFLAGYRGRIEAWPYREIDPQPGELDALLVRAGSIWPGSYPGVTTGYPTALTARARPAGQ